MVVGLLVVAMAAFALSAGISGGGEDMERSGQLHVASVENNHTARVEVVVFTVTADEVMVDGNASTVWPTAEEDFGLLVCRDDQFVASRLRILVNTDRETGYEIERFVELEEGDCAEGGGAVFSLSVDGEQELVVDVER